MYREENAKEGRGARGVSTKRGLRMGKGRRNQARRGPAKDAGRGLGLKGGGCLLAVAE